MAHIRQSRLDAGLGFQIKSSYPSKVLFPSCSAAEGRAKTASRHLGPLAAPRSCRDLSAAAWLRLPSEQGTSCQVLRTLT